ncbi:hypothetical protein D3C71_2023030 [compost metagenome]
MDFLHSWNVSTVLAMALMLVAAAMLVLGLGMARRLRGQNRSRQVVDHALARQEPSRARCAGALRRWRRWSV